MALDVDRREDIDPAIVLDYQPDPPKKVEPYVPRNRPVADRPRVHAPQPVEMQSFRAIEREVTG